MNYPWRENMILEKIIIALSKLLDIPASQINPDSLLSDLYGWDSLNSIRFIDILENELNIVIPLSRIEKMNSINDYARLIDEIK
jgi:acyl carrier protein